MTVGRTADNALMTPPNPTGHVDTKVLPARCREFRNSALKFILFVLRVGDHGLEVSLAIGRWLPISEERKERASRRQIRFWNINRSQQNV